MRKRVFNDISIFDNGSCKQFGSSTKTSMYICLQKTDNIKDINNCLRDNIFIYFLTIFYLPNDALHVMAIAITASQVALAVPLTIKHL